MEMYELHNMIFRFWMITSSSWYTKIPTNSCLSWLFATEKPPDSILKPLSWYRTIYMNTTCSWLHSGRVLLAWVHIQPILFPHTQHVTYEMTSWVATAYLSLRTGSIDWRALVFLVDVKPHMHCSPPALGKHRLPSLQSPACPFIMEGQNVAHSPFRDSIWWAEMLSCSRKGLQRRQCRDRRLWSLCYLSISERAYCVNSRNNLLAAGGLSSTSHTDQQLVWVSTTNEPSVMISFSVCDDVSLHVRGSDNKEPEWLELFGCVFQDNLCCSFLGGSVLTQLT